jgi:hypothetical protein
LTSTLARRQLRVTPWSGLRSGSGDAASVGSDLELLLFAEGDDDDGAYERLENEAESQGHLFECAPAVVSVIVAAVAEASIPSGNLATSLDVLGRIVAGYPDESEVALGRPDLRERCHDEAMKGVLVADVGRKRAGPVQRVAGCSVRSVGPG